MKLRKLLVLLLATALLMQTGLAADASVFYRAANEILNSLGRPVSPSKPSLPQVEILPKVDSLLLGVGEKIPLPGYSLLPEDSDAIISYVSASNNLGITEKGMLNPKRTGSYTLSLVSECGASASIPVEVRPAPRSISISAPTEEIILGESILCTAVLNSGSAGSVSWHSSQPEVLENLGGGSFRAIAAGSARITAETYNGKSASLKIEVRIPECSILLDSHALRIGMGDGLLLGCTAGSGIAAPVEFSTSDATIAVVDADGRITPISPGECVITASVPGIAEDACTLTVCPAPEQILLHAPFAELGLKDSMPIGVSFLPEGSCASLQFSSSDARTLSVDSQGVVTGLRMRTATITVQAHNGVFQKLRIPVVGAPKSISLDLSSDTLAIGEIALANVSFPKASGGSYSFSCQPEGIVSISPEGAISAISAGETILTATSYNGHASSRSITVLEAPDEIFLDPEMKMAIGSTERLYCSLPEGSASALYFESLNPECASVDANGMISAHKLGEAVVRVHAQNSPAVSECRVFVLPAPQQLSLAETEITLYEGQSRAVECFFQPEGSYAALRYQAEDGRIAGTDAFGDILARNPGATRVAVSTFNGLGAEILVHVLPAPDWIGLNESMLNLVTGETFLLECILPGSAQAGVRFSSAQPQIAAVDPETGLVTAISTGTACITAVTATGEIASCIVNVNIDLEPWDTVSGNFEIHFMDIGRNDGILIHCGGEYAFIDSGFYSYGAKAVKFMQEHGVTRLKYYIGTHAHRDHVAGATHIIESIPTDMIIVPHKYCRTLMIELCKTPQQKAIMQNTPWKILSKGQKIYIGGAKITCLGPISIENHHYSSTLENGNSLVTRITYGDNSFLLTGDANEAEMKEIIQVFPGMLYSDLFKNPHHDQEMHMSVVNHIKPKITIFSTSNSAWPNWNYLNALRQLGSKIYFTATGKNGNILVTSDGTNLTVIPQRGKAMED